MSETYHAEPVPGPPTSFIIRNHLGDRLCETTCPSSADAIVQAMNLLMDFQNPRRIKFIPAVPTPKGPWTAKESPIPTAQSMWRWAVLATEEGPSGRPIIARATNREDANMLAVALNDWEAATPRPHMERFWKSMAELWKAQCDVARLLAERLKGRVDALEGALPVGPIYWTADELARVGVAFRTGDGLMSDEPNKERAAADEVAAILRERAAR